MAKMDAQVGIRYEMNVHVRSKDGFTLAFSADDSLRSWWAIVRWNIHHRHWRIVFLNNAPDLFRKVLRRKLWQRFA